MSDAFHPIDAHCLALFPELLEQFSEDELRSASAIGTYIFHEDYFARFAESQASNEAMLRRIADYIEYLATNADYSRRDLAEIGLLEGLVSKEDHRIAPFLGPVSMTLVERVLPNFEVDPEPWRSARKR